MRYFDLHCDTMSACAHDNISLRENKMHVSLKKAEAIDTYVQCFAAFIPDSFRGQSAVDWFEQVADRLYSEVGRNGDEIKLCRDTGDLALTEVLHKHGAVLTIESGAALGGKLENIADWKRRGVRMCTLTWNGETELGRGIMSAGSTGLSDFGREAVEKFEENGIIVDISHASPELFWDVAEVAKKPLVASHSNAKSICGHVRNLTDEQFEAVKKSGGLVGLNFYNAFLNDKPEKATMEDILRHAEHFLSLGGENVIAMGGDMDGSDLPEDMSDGLGAIPRLYELFLKNNYSEELVDKLFYGNAANFFKNNNLL